MTGGKPAARDCTHRSSGPRRSGVRHLDGHETRLGLYHLLDAKEGQRHA